MNPKNETNEKAERIAELQCTITRYKNELPGLQGLVKKGERLIVQLRQMVQDFEARGIESLLSKENISGLDNCVRLIQRQNLKMETMAKGMQWTMDDARVKLRAAERAGAPAERV